jgi:hypothetical protein
MRSTSRLWLPLITLVLLGCAGKPTVMDQQKLHSLSLYDESNRARFTVYISCTSSDWRAENICTKTKFVFAQWADEREISVTPVDVNNSLFTQDELQGWRLPVLAENKPFVMAIHLSPEVTPAFGSVMDNAGRALAVGSKLARVGYSAKIRVFDATSGKMLEQISSHEFLSVKPEADTAPYMGATLADLVSNLDPSYDLGRPATPKH